MITRTFKWIFFIVFLLIMQCAAVFSVYETVFREESFLLESIYQVISSDLDEDGNDEFILSGKNYTGREVFLYWLETGENFLPVVRWQSENLFEERSVIWTVFGRFSAEKPQLLAISSTKVYIYQFEDNTLKPVLEATHQLIPKGTKTADYLLNITGGDVDGDGWTELIVARVGKITNKIFDGMLQVWRFNGTEWTLLGESDLLGNIRGLGIGDLDEDGCDEIIVEEGFRFDPGNIHLLRYKDSKVSEFYIQKKATKNAIYDLKYSYFPEGKQFIMASATGKIYFYHWQNDALVPIGPEMTFKVGLVGVTVVDLDRDATPELVVAGYPGELIILKEQSGDAPK